MEEIVSAIKGLSYAVAGLGLTGTICVLALCVSLNEIARAIRSK